MCQGKKMKVKRHKNNTVKKSTIPVTELTFDPTRDIQNQRIDEVVEAEEVDEDIDEEHHEIVMEMKR